MNALATIYAGVVAMRNALYDRGWLPAPALEGPVVSIGNLSTGGSGKTPFVILLGELLKARDVNFDVLSRGYGRETKGVLLVDPAGGPKQFGDEPLLIARKLKVPVIVGEDRFAAGQFAERKFGPQLHLLDDGFQHRALARDFDIVLTTADDATDHLLPTGRLREPLTSLKRADAVALMPGASADGLSVSGKRVWQVHRGVASPAVPSRPVAFCGIARPQAFVNQLRAAGVCPVASAFYRDHHAYIERDIHELRELAQRSAANGFVTTEKDAINLGSFAAQLDPLCVVQVTMHLDNAADVVDTILQTVSQRKQRSVRKSEQPVNQSE